MEWTDPVPVRVAIAEGHALVRGGFHALLEGEQDMTVVGGAGDGDEAVALAENTEGAPATETAADIQDADAAVPTAEESVPTAGEHTDGR